jgi:hypothetical protein
MPSRIVPAVQTKTINFIPIPLLIVAPAFSASLIELKYLQWLYLCQTKTITASKYCSQ